MTQAMAPTHQPTATTKITVPVIGLVHTGPSAASGATSGTPSLIADVTISATIESMNMADSAVMRAPGRTNSAATASSSAIQATTALRP